MSLWITTDGLESLIADLRAARAAFKEELARADKGVVVASAAGAIIGKQALELDAMEESLQAERKLNDAWFKAPFFETKEEWAEWRAEVEPLHEKVLKIRAALPPEDP